MFSSVLSFFQCFRFLLLFFQKNILVDCESASVLNKHPMETSAARPIMNFPVNIFAWSFFKIFGVFKKEVILFPRIQEI